MVIEGKRKKKKLLGREQLLCLAAATVLSVFLAVLQRNGSAAGEVTSLLRNPYGGNAETQELLIEGLLEEPIPVEIEVGARKYTKEAAETAFAALVERLPELILAENRSLSEVRSNLKLPGKDTESGIRLQWYPENPDLISYTGEVQNGELKSAQETYLRVVMTDGDNDRSFRISVTVHPRIYGASEFLMKRLSDELKKADAEQIFSEELRLPEKIDGREIRFRRKTGREPLLIFLLGLLAAVLLRLREGEEAKKERALREKELRVDYSELVSKLMVYLGAGMTIKNAWIRIVSAYREARAKGRGEKRVLYEEMERTLNDMERGMPEGEAYQAFGQRCALQPYRKLCALIEQNRKNGSRNLRLLLRMEMDYAFEERKNIAKRLGEEAGTRLLIPLFMMLIVVMVIVILPAMLSMG